MITIASKNHRQSIERVLRKLAVRAERRGPDHWSFTTDDWSFAEATVHLLDDWLIVAVRCDSLNTHRDADALYPLLTENGALGPGVKYTITPSGNPAARADMPLVENSDAGALFEEALFALKSAVGGKTGQAVAEHSGGGADILNALTECTLGDGWAFDARSDTACSFRFTGSRQDRTYHVRATPAPNECIRFQMDLAVLDVLSPPSRAALTVFLLTGAYALRLVRPVLVEQDDRTIITIEYLSGQAPSDESLQHVLTAFAVGFETLVREIDALCDEDCAEMYLAARGWTARLNGNERPAGATTLETVS